MVSRRWAVVAVLALSLALAGCTDSTESCDPADLDADQYEGQELAAAASESMASADSYSFAAEKTIDVEDDAAEGGNAAYTVDIQADGTANARQDASRMELTTGLETESGTLSFVAEGLHLGDRAYIREQNSAEWNQTASGVDWSAADQQVALLDGATVEVAGTGCAGDREAILLSVEPADDRAVASYGLDRNVSADPRPPAADVESADVTTYVSPEEPHYVYRTELEATTVAGTSEFTTDAALSYDAFEEDVAVDVPEDLET